MSETSNISIGIQGLPNLSANMMSGGLYVLVAELPSARFPLLAGGLASALKANQTCSVIVHSNPELFIRRVESFDCFNTAELMAVNRLNFFVMQDEFSKKIFRFGTDSFVKELEQFDIPENSYLLFDQADELLSLHDISLALDQIDVLSKWFAQRKVTSLLVFSRSTSEHSGTINALMDHLTGIARLSGDRDGLEITFDYWQSPEGTITARNYPLLTLDSGLYEATTRTVLSRQVNEEERFERKEDIPDAEPHYFYMDPDLDDMTGQVPGIWQRVDTSIGMMLASRNMRTATCILSFDGDSNLQQLAETVHSLRVSLGRYARIVVQEKEASLGNQSEALLLRLGVSLVVRRDVPITRMPALLESLSGQVFKRDVEVSFEAAVESAFPPKQPAYLPVQAFVREVIASLDRAEGLGVPCAMVVGKPMPGLTVVDILTRNVLTRSGDRMTSDGQSCYVFLNVCPQSEIVTTLEQILGMAVESAFDDPKLFIQREEIQPELATLLQTSGLIDSTDSLTAKTSRSTVEHISSGSTPEKPLFVPMTHSAKSAATTRSPTTLPVNSPQSQILAPPPTTPAAVVTPTFTAPMRQQGNQLAASNGFADASSEEPLFVYDSASSTPAFGKKEVPRATRSAAK
ncbi:MAG: hypothetical protein EAZ34_03005 [Polaromonas sp.]|nr:MAG: hypothetical protein EAZ34_03005 [Polaromonas sp.]